MLSPVSVFNQYQKRDIIQTCIICQKDKESYAEGTVIVHLVYKKFRQVLIVYKKYEMRKKIKLSFLI